MFENPYEVTPVTLVEPLEGFAVRLTFADGREGVLDLEPFLWGEVLEPLRDDPALFRAVYLDYDTIVWPNGADIAPETLHEKLRVAKAEAA